MKLSFHIRIDDILRNFNIFIRSDRYYSKNKNFIRFENIVMKTDHLIILTEEIIAFTVLLFRKEVEEK